MEQITAREFQLKFSKYKGKDVDIVGRDGVIGEWRVVKQSLLNKGNVKQDVKQDVKQSLLNKEISGDELKKVAMGNTRELLEKMGKGELVEDEEEIMGNIENVLGEIMGKECWLCGESGVRRAAEWEGIWNEKIGEEVELCDFHVRMMAGNMYKKVIQKYRKI